MKVAVIGGNGQLGTDIAEAFANRGDDVVGLTHQDIQVENADSVRKVLVDLKPDIVLNTAAFHNVPKCEDDPVRSYNINALGALHIARLSDELKFANVYYSTDYVFDGAKKAPYIESDAPNPLNVYASTKLLGEYYTMNYARKGIVIRSSGIYGKVPCRAKGGNFITTMVRLAGEKPEVRVVRDEVLTPTPTSEIANKSVAIVASGASGLFHLTCEGECSWYEFAQVIFATLRLKTPLHPASVDEFPSPVRRPFYSVLENRRAKDLGLPMMPHWRDSLVTFLRNQYGAV
jgi:dTDP-4-dehydrorhamnose reductase